MSDGDLVDGCVVISCERVRFDDVQDLLEHNVRQHAVRGAASGQGRPLEEHWLPLRWGFWHQGRNGRGASATAAAAAAAAAAAGAVLLVLVALLVLLVLLVPPVRLGCRWGHRAHLSKYPSQSWNCRKGCGDL
jgi:hypothetical protein